MDSVEEGAELRVEVETLKYRMVHETYEYKEVFPMRHVADAVRDRWDYSYMVEEDRSVPPTRKYSNTLIVKELILAQEEFEALDNGYTEIRVGDLDEWSLIPTSRILAIEPMHDKPYEPQPNKILRMI